MSKIGNLALLLIEGAMEAFRRRGEVRGCYLGRRDCCRARQDEVGGGGTQGRLSSIARCGMRMVREDFSTSTHGFRRVSWGEG